MFDFSKIKNISLLRLRLIQFSYLIAYWFRKKRRKIFLEFIKEMTKPIYILDIGGTEYFWWQMGLINKKELKITLLNRWKQPTQAKNIKSIVGDARDLSLFKERQFDIVFSNSLIEHLGTYKNQLQMAKEAQRVGKAYFIQTPNKFFPIEPHFLLPFFFLIPKKIRPFLVYHLSLKCRGRFTSMLEVNRFINSIRLVTEEDLKKMFPRATIFKEKVFGLTKSFTVYKKFH